MTTTHYNTINHIADGTVDRLEGLNIMQLASSRVVYDNILGYTLVVPIKINENLVSKPSDRTYKELGGLLISIFGKSADRKVITDNMKVLKPKKTYLIKGIRLYKKYYPVIKY